MVSIFEQSVVVPSLPKLSAKVRVLKIVSLRRSCGPPPMIHLPLHTICSRGILVFILIKMKKGFGQGVEESTSKRGKKFGAKTKIGSLIQTNRNPKMEQDFTCWNICS